MKTSKLNSFNGKYILVYLVSLILIISGCTRYSYLPRKHQYFNSKKEKKTEEVQVARSKEKSNAITLNDGTELQELAANSGTGSKDYKSEYEDINQNDFDEGRLDNPVKHKGIKYGAIKNAPGNRDKKGIFSLSGQVKPGYGFLKKIKQGDPGGEPQEGDGKEFNILAAVSAALGIIGWAAIAASYLFGFGDILFVVSVLASIGAIITGIIALSSTRHNREDYNNRFMALIGLIMGGLEILVLLVYIIFIILLLILLF